VPPFTPASPHNIPSAAKNVALNYSFFMQWRFSLPAQFTLTAGTGWNFIEFSTKNLLNAGTPFLNNPANLKVFKPVLTPGVTLSRPLGAVSSVYASVNKGYAPATLAQITNSTGAINTGLKPERATQYEVGTKGTTKNSKWAWQAAVFDMEIVNRLVQETANSITFYTNASRQRNLGGELYIGYALKNNREAPVSLLRPWISYTYSHFRYTDFQSHGKASTGEDTILANYGGNRVAAVPEHVFNAGMDIASKKGFYLNTTYRFVDRAPVTFDMAHFMKPYHLLSAKVGFQHAVGKHLTLDLYAGADNLLGSTWYSFLFVGQNIQELAQANDPYVQGGGGDGYILPAPYKATYYGGASVKYIF
jgi:iron complex outermembrane recepter protein